MPTPAGYKIWEQTAAVTVASSPVVSGWYDTTGYTNLFISYVFTNTTGTTTLTVEGSFDGSTQETDIVYAAVGATPATVTGVMYSQTFQPGGVTGIYPAAFAAPRAVRAGFASSGSPVSSSRNSGVRSGLAFDASRSRFTSSCVSGYGSPFTTSRSVLSSSPAA